MPIATQQIPARMSRTIPEIILSVEVLFFFVSILYYKKRKIGMLNQGNNMSYYGRSEYFRHLRIERLDGDVTPVFSDYLRTVRTLPFTVVTCQERLEGFPYHGSSCIFDDEGEIHAEGASCWVIPAGVRHRFLALDEGHLSIWGHFNFFLEPNWNILRFYRVPRLLEGEIRERICGLVRILAENRHETLSEVCRLKRAEFELLELILEQSEPRLGLQDFRTAYLDFLPLLEYIRVWIGWPVSSAPPVRHWRKSSGRRSAFPSENSC